MSHAFQTIWYNYWTVCVQYFFGIQIFCKYISYIHFILLEPLQRRLSPAGPRSSLILKATFFWRKKLVTKFFEVGWKFQISGTTLEVALALFCHQRETAIVAEFSSNASNTVFTAYALEKRIGLILSSVSDKGGKLRRELFAYPCVVTGQAVSHRSLQIVTTSSMQLRAIQARDKIHTWQCMNYFHMTERTHVPWPENRAPDMVSLSFLSLSSPPECRVPDIGSDLEEGKNAREDNHRVWKEVVYPGMRIS